MKMRFLLALILSTGSIVHSQITLTFQENGSDLIVFAGGQYEISFDSTDGSYSTLLYRAVDFHILWHRNGSGAISASGTFTGDYPFELGDSFYRNGIAVSGSDPFGFYTDINDPTNSFVYGPAGFGPGTTLSAGTKVTFTGTSLIEFGMGVGDSGTFSIGTQTFNWSAISAVPEPSTYAAIAFGVLGFTLIAKRRVRKKSEDKFT